MVLPDMPVSSGNTYLVIFITFENDPYYVLTEDENVAKFNNKYINEVGNTEEQEMIDYFFTEDGKFKFETLKTPFTLSGDFTVICCGALP